MLDNNPRQPRLEPLESLTFPTIQTTLKNRFTDLFSQLATRVLRLLTIQQTINLIKFIFYPCKAIYSGIDRVAQTIIKSIKSDTTQPAISSTISAGDELLKDVPPIAARRSASKTIHPNEGNPSYPTLIVKYPI